MRSNYSTRFLNLCFVPRLCRWLVVISSASLLGVYSSMWCPSVLSPFVVFTVLSFTQFQGFGAVERQW